MTARAWGPPLSWLSDIGLAGHPCGDYVRGTQLALSFCAGAKASCPSPTTAKKPHGSSTTAHLRMGASGWSPAAPNTSHCQMQISAGRSVGSAAPTAVFVKISTSLDVAVHHSKFDISLCVCMAAAALQSAATTAPTVILLAEAHAASRSSSMQLSSCSRAAAGSSAARWSTKTLLSSAAYLEPRGW